MELHTRMVFMTLPEAEVAGAIVRKLVEEKLVACGNVLSGVTSIYRWEGNVQQDDEVLVIMKTTAQAVAPLLERAAELHPYECPEILAIPVEEGYRPYMDWVKDCVATRGMSG